MQWDLKIKETEEDPSGLSEGWEKEIQKNYFRESILEQITRPLTKPCPEVK